MEYYIFKDEINLDDSIKYFVRFLKEYGVYASYKHLFQRSALKSKNEFLRFNNLDDYDKKLKICEAFFSFKSYFKSMRADCYVMLMISNVYKSEFELNYWFDINNKWVEYASSLNLIEKMKIKKK